MELLVAGTESRVVDIRVVDRSAAGADEVSRNVVKTSTGGIRIAGRRISNVLVSSKQLDRSVGVFANQHHAGVIGKCRGKNLRQYRRQRVAGKRYRHGVRDVAANCVERRGAASQVGKVPADLELVGT